MTTEIRNNKCTKTIVTGIFSGAVSFGVEGISLRKNQVIRSALMSTASAAFSPKVTNMNGVVHSQVAATIKTGGAAKLVSVPPIEIFTNNTPIMAY